MRKFFFVILLIGAAFAGGAAVNGPGLRWAQAMILQRLGSATDDANDASKASTGDDSSNPADPSQPMVTETPGAGGGIPSAPVTPLAVEPAKPVPAPKKEQESGPKTVAGAPPELPEPPAQPAPEPVKVALPSDPRTPEPLPPLSMAPAGQTLPPLEVPTDSAPDPKATDNKARAKDQDPAWGDAPGSAPATAVPPKPFKDQAQAQNPAERDAAVERVAAPADSPASASGDWSALRRKMRDLGVSRYNFEGEPGGRVRFSCVIPLAGRRAVGQQFEAEGDDEFQAAQVALRRVALWRATENPRQ